MQRLILAAGIVMAGAMAGCVRVTPDAGGQLQSYPVPTVEAGWIRNGEPIELDGHKWYPVDDIENLLDGEMYQIGEYKDTSIFVEKIDTKPYNRIYTKFAKNKFRYFERGDD